MRTLRNYSSSLPFVCLAYERCNKGPNGPLEFPWLFRPEALKERTGSGVKVEFLAEVFAECSQGDVELGRDLRARYAGDGHACDVGALQFSSLEAREDPAAAGQISLRPGEMGKLLHDLKNPLTVGYRAVRGLGCLTRSAEQPCAFKIGSWANEGRDFFDLSR